MRDKMTVATMPTARITKYSETSPSPRNMETKSPTTNAAKHVFAMSKKNLPSVSRLVFYFSLSSLAVISLFYFPIILIFPRNKQFPTQKNVSW